MTDMGFLEELAALSSGRPPERLWFVKGAGAGGVFRPYMDMSDYTSAAFLTDPETETPAWVRFSLCGGCRGAADTRRDDRGFSVKFFTSQGEYDLMGTSLPVFFIADPKKFPDLLTAIRPCAATDLR
ncbi:MAG: catalase, partial [Bacillota bacterium]|nr:catalase [Bacillota bacterium]